MMLSRALLAVVCGLLSTMAVAADPEAPVSKQPYLYVLGVAQDAGYPQAGCYQPHCMPGWENHSLRRGATSIALIDPTAGAKYLFDATPNLPEQLYRLEVEAPSAQYALGGVFLTHAHIGHYAGLMYFGHEAMGGDQIPVYAMPRMTAFLTGNGPWSQLVDYQNIVLKPLSHNKPVILAGLSVTPILVPHRDEFSETVGYLISSAKKSALFIPDINKWSLWDIQLATMIQQVDYALLDATFFGDGELPGRDMSAVPHPLVTETMGALDHLPADQRNKVWFIHMNHTNPMLDPSSTEAQLVISAGYNIAKPGSRLPL